MTEKEEIWRTLKEVAEDRVIKERINELFELHKQTQRELRLVRIL